MRRRQHRGLEGHGSGAVSPCYVLVLTHCIDDVRICMLDEGRAARIREVRHNGVLVGSSVVVGTSLLPWSGACRDGRMDSQVSESTDASSGHG